MRTRILSGLTALLVVAGAIPVLAVGPGTIDSGAVAGVPAVRISQIATDVVSIFNSGPMRPEVATSAISAARQAGASVGFGRSASVGMIGLFRGSTPVQLPPAGFAYPMGITGLPPEVVAGTMGRDVSALLAVDAVIMGETSAGLRGARVGDTIQVAGASGSVLWFRVAGVFPDARIGGAELLMSTVAADRVGTTSFSGAVLWNPSSRGAMDSALADNALVSTSIRIRRSWDPPDPDDTIGMARTKALLGEFAYRVNADGSVSQDEAWVAASLPSDRVVLNGSIPIRARCHNVVEPALSAALAEVAAKGLAGTIDVVNANTYGGCHLARFNRLTPDSTLGFLSRHSWGMALDTNTVGSCQGCDPPDFATLSGGCATVQIFRKHGFAWGGNFLTPDGMHFEYVGERRDLLPYPSRYCPNTGAAALTDAEAGIDTFFADDGLPLEDH